MSAPKIWPIIYRNQCIQLAHRAQALYGPEPHRTQIAGLALAELRMNRGLREYIRGELAPLDPESRFMADVERYLSLASVVGL